MKVWPLEQTAQKTSISGILSRLESFSYEASSEACGVCRFNYNGHVAESRAKVESYFDGLCLDCMDRSQPKSGNIDMDYWRHDRLSESEYIAGFRIKHKQPTWYFSFMGRQEERERIRRYRRKLRGVDFADDW